MRKDIVLFPLFGAIVTFFFSKWSSHAGRDSIQMQPRDFPFFSFFALLFRKECR